MKRYAGYVALLALTLGLLSVASPATAETVSKRDRLNDAPARIDIKKVTYAYDGDTVSVDATIPDLGRSGRAALTIPRFELFEAGYVLRIAKMAGHPALIRLYYFDHFDLNRRRCGGLTGQWRDAGIKMTVPTNCLRGHARPNVRAQLTSVNGREYDRAPAVRRLARS